MGNTSSTGDRASGQNNCAGRGDKARGDDASGSSSSTEVRNGMRGRSSQSTCSPKFEQSAWAGTNCGKTGS